MRNSVRVLDPSIEKITIATLRAGALFRFPSSHKSPDNVYIKCSNNIGVVLLSTGAYYTNFDPDASIEPVFLVQINTT